LWVSAAATLHTRADPTQALDEAVRISTWFNVNPIRGRTLVLCNVGVELAVPCTSAKGLGKPR
jgi:telomerase protein component 1